jgi:hypothetical protein
MLAINIDSSSFTADVNRGLCCCKLLHTCSLSFLQKISHSRLLRPPLRRTPAANPSMRQLCARGPNACFCNMCSIFNSAPQAAALQPGYFGAAAAPSTSRLAERYRKAAAKGGQNARRSSNICFFNVFCKHINCLRRTSMIRAHQGYFQPMMMV